jgi:hypothetical protein
MWVNSSNVEIAFTRFLNFPSFDTRNVMNLESLNRPLDGSMLWMSERIVWSKFVSFCGLLSEGSIFRCSSRTIGRILSNKSIENNQ